MRDVGSKNSPQKRKALIGKQRSEEKKGLHRGSYGYFEGHVDSLSFSS